MANGRVPACHNFGWGAVTGCSGTHAAGTETPPVNASRYSFQQPRRKLLKDQRKRVAKRLASGLLAGALALGGLAISGGTASANTPTSPSTQRISGADRYETAVAVARSQLNGGNPTALVIASGESVADALAGAVLNNNTSTIPMLLVQKDSIPSSVSDFIADYKASISTGSVKVWVLGGTSAISAATFDAIKSAVTTAGSLTPPVVTRVSGDDRYATAKAISDIAGVTDASDTLIIANGENGKWADALSVGPISAGKEWPIALTTSTGLQASAKAKIDAYNATPGSAKKYLIIGGTASVPTSVEDYLLTLSGVAPSSIQRIAGVDRYHTNLLVQTWSLGGLALNPSLLTLNGQTLALVSGDSPFDALVSAGWAAAKGAHLLLTPAAGGNTFTNLLAAALAGLRDNQLGTNASLWVIGGRSAVNDSAKTAYVAASGTNLTSTLICPTRGAASGSKNLILVLSAGLPKSLNPGAIIGGLTPADAMASSSAMAPYVKVNGAASVIAAGGTDIGDVYENARQTWLIPLTALPTIGSTVTFSGWTEGTAVGAVTPTFSIGASSCTVGADTTAPALTMRVLPGNATGQLTGTGNRILVTSSESVSISSAAGNILVGGVATTTSAVITNLATGLAVGASGAKSFLIQLNDYVTISATNAIELRAAAVADLAGNPAATTVAASAAADATAPTITVDGVSVTASGQAAYAVGSLQVSAAATGAWDGAKGSSFTIKVTNQRGLLTPTVAIDGTAKTIVVTADTGYHTVADVRQVALNTGLMSALATVGAWKIGPTGAGALTDKITANSAPATCGATCGQSTVTIAISGSEPFYLNKTGTVVTVGGLGIPFVSGTNLDNNTSYDATADAKTGLLTSRYITFNTAYAGAGVVAFLATADGVNDIAGNRVVAPITFTV